MSEMRYGLEVGDLALLDDPALDVLGPFTTMRGTWDAGVLSLSAPRVFFPGDIVAHKRKVYLCVVGFTAGTSASAPDADATHWEPLPLLAAQTLIFDDNFSEGSAGEFRNRPVKGLAGKNWGTSGLGWLDAIVQSATPRYATGNANTYYCAQALPGPITELGAIMRDNLSSQLFTLAIANVNGSPNHIIGPMVHLNAEGPANGCYGHVYTAASSALVTDQETRFHASRPIALTNGGQHEIIMRLRGNWLMGMVDGKPALAVCNPKIGQISSIADGIYFQTHGNTMGAERCYRVWTKRAA